MAFGCWLPEQIEMIVVKRVDAVKKGIKDFTSAVGL